MSYHACIILNFAEKDSKKNKNDKKTQNGGISQPKQKDKKPKKANKSFIGKGEFLVNFLTLVVSVHREERPAW